MKVWFSAQEIADLALPGLPASKAGVRKLAEREQWDCHSDELARLRAGREGGGGYEYHLELLPLPARLAYVQALLPAPAPGMGAVAAPPAASGKAALLRDARAYLLQGAERFARDSGLTVLPADRLFAELYNHGASEQPDWVRAEIKSISGRTLARWRSGSKAGGVEALATDASQNRKGTGVLDRAQDGAVKHYILALLAKNPHFTGKHIRNAVLHRFPGEVVPNVRGFQRVISAWKIEFRNELMRIADPDGHRSKVEFVATGTTSAERLNERWQIDASPLDAMTIPEGALTITGKRPTIYSCIDIYSRRMLILVTATPRAAAVGLLLRKAMIAWGVPEEIKTDNGSDFKANYIERLFSRLNITAIPTRAYDARAKGVVERSIGTFQRDFATVIPGFVGHNPGQRNVLEKRKAFSKRHDLDDAHLFDVDMTDAEVADYADHWAEVEYAHNPHSGKTMGGRTPFEVAAGYRGTIRRIDNVDALDILLAPVAGKNGLRTVGHEGIVHNRSHYLLGSVLVGDSVFCRQDPRDLGRLYVFKPDEESFIGIAVCPALAGLDPIETIARVRATQKAIEDKSVAPIRRIARSIGPRDVANAQRAAAADRAGSLIAFPGTSVAHETAALKAALDAITPRPERQADSRTQAEQQRLLAKAASDATPKTNVVALPESPAERYRRALAIRARIEAGEAGVAPTDAIWAGRYMESSEFRGLAKLHAMRGEQAAEL